MRIIPMWNTRWIGDCKLVIFPKLVEMLMETEILKLSLPEVLHSLCVICVNVQYSETWDYYVYQEAIESFTTDMAVFVKVHHFSWQ